MQTGETVDIQPRLKGEELRFAWMTPFFPSSHHNLSLYCGANRVFKSTDRGDSWKPISENLVSSDRVSNIRYRAITALAESRLQPRLLFAGTDNGDLHVTQDDGQTWNDIGYNLKKPITRICISPNNTERVYVSHSGAGEDDYSPYVYRSNDLGKTWKSISDGLPDEPINVIYEDPRVSSLLYVGTDMGVYASTDGGESWQSLCSNLPTTSVYDLFVHPRDNELVIGTHGRSCYMVDATSIQNAAKK